MKTESQRLVFARARACVYTAVCRKVDARESVSDIVRKSRKHLDLSQKYRREEFVVKHRTTKWKQKPFLMENVEIVWRQICEKIKRLSVCDSEHSACPFHPGKYVYIIG